MRSIWGWVMLMTRPFAICLRKTIQNVGACRGLVLLVSVRYKKGREAFAEMDTRNCPLLPLHVKSSSSFSGCAILLIFVFKIVWFSSWTKPAITIPSKAMEILLFMIIVFFKLMNHYSNFHVFCLYAESGYLLYTFFARTFDETAKKHYNTFIYA